MEIGNPKLRIVVLFSGGASGPLELAKKDKHYGKMYELAGAFTDVKGAKGIEVCSRLDISVISLDYRDWCRERGIENRFTTLLRPVYFEEVAALLEELFGPFDLIMCSGFMMKITPNFVAKYWGRIINVHPSLGMKYRGAHAVHDALAAGEQVTGAAVHLIDFEVDHGPVIAESDPLPVEGRDADAQQDLMKQECDVVAFIRALEDIYEGGEDFLRNLIGKMPSVPAWQP